MVEVGKEGFPGVAVVVKMVEVAKGGLMGVAVVDGRGDGAKGVLVGVAVAVVIVSEESVALMGGGSLCGDVRSRREGGVRAMRRREVMEESCEIRMNVN